MSPVEVRRGLKRLGSIVVLALAMTAAGGAAALAAVSVTDAQVTEGDSGTVDMTFTITHDGFYTYETNDGTPRRPSRLPVHLRGKL